MNRDTSIFFKKKVNINQKRKKTFPILIGSSTLSNRTLIYGIEK